MFLPDTLQGFPTQVLMTDLSLHIEHKWDRRQDQKPTKGKKMALTSSLPLPLQKAIDQLPDFIKSIRKTRPGLIRAMRPERQDSMTRLLTAMLLSCSLQHDGAICHINDKWAKPKTVEELAEQAKISFSNAKRCLSDLKKMGYITSRQIKRKNRISGQIEVSPGLRFFTSKFWMELRLWDLFRQSMEWAKKHCKRKFLMPFKGIKTKVGNTMKQAGEIAGEVLKTLSADSQRTKFWCNKIITMLNR